MHVTCFRWSANRLKTAWDPNNTLRTDQKTPRFDVLRPIPWHLVRTTHDHAKTCGFAPIGSHSSTLARSTKSRLSRFWASLALWHGLCASKHNSRVHQNQISNPKSSQNFSKFLGSYLGPTLSMDLHALDRSLCMDPMHRNHTFTHTHKHLHSYGSDSRTCISTSWTLIWTLKLKLQVIRIIPKPSLVNVCIRKFLKHGRLRIGKSLCMDPMHKHTRTEIVSCKL